MRDGGLKYHLTHTISDHIDPAQPLGSTKEESSRTLVNYAAPFPAPRTHAFEAECVRGWLSKPRAPLPSVPCSKSCQRGHEQGFDSMQRTLPANSGQPAFYSCFGHPRMGHSLCFCRWTEERIEDDYCWDCGDTSSHTPQTDQRASQAKNSRAAYRVRV